ncbi:PREDICTED: uncharacterized protein LOC109582004 [Amphimedon queenslandica]|uniref:CARD domain-containing protein n=1 Tax=Amphimedon queenslandica TaxID=400682 RepID=A0A1X7UW85_AMPQE|nr:PREDICTED: uncharacterized protein LOC109582004 [Amphimedon queenslandica]|eukprot:XP_019852102.1 PREDICTED: uncharacterized protein LOC109582004 [Amphimedon queenslandica]
MAGKTTSIVESASPSSIFKKNFVKFKNLLARDPNFCDFTDIFFSKDLITKNELDAISSQPNLSSRERSSKVTHYLFERIKNSDDPKKCVLTICEALEDENIDDNQAKKIATAIRTDLEPPLQVHVHDPELPLVSTPTTNQDNTREKIFLENRIWTRGEDGEDIIKLCIEKLKESRIFPDDNKLMHRIAHVMSRNSCNFCNDGGIWQVSMFAFQDTHDTRSHIRLGRKYERIMQHFGINWRKVERSYLTIPIYSAIAARLYLSNFPKFIPPEYNIKEQADYWWEIYMEKHESRDFIKCQTFIDTVTALEGDSDIALPCIEKRIWVRGESGEDVVNLCIEEVHASGIASIDGVFLRRVAFVNCDVT